MLQVQFDTRGFDKVINDLKRGNKKALSMAMHDTADFIYDLALPNIPHDTGDLLDSWRKEIISELEILIGYDIEYAQYQHQGRRADGSHQIRNRPAGGKTFWFKKAIDENYDLIIDYFIKRLKKYLKL